MLNQDPHSFTKGDQVEVSRPKCSPSGPYYPATVLRSRKKKARILVEYQTLMCDENGSKSSDRLTEHVDLVCVRPAPPCELNRRFRVGDNVDGFCKNVWRRGTVTDIFENSRYFVKINDDEGEIELQQCNLRLHREWDDGSWVPSVVELQKQNEASEMTVEPRSIKLTIKCTKPSDEKFKRGDAVEVRSDDEGYQGAWYTAIIVDSIRNDEYLVQYSSLKTDDGIGPLQVAAYTENIRPSPPTLPYVVRFNRFEEVDAWYDEGWWDGVISDVLDGMKYRVYFDTTNRELTFAHFILRRRQDWINGKWVIASKLKSNECKINSQDPRVKMDYPIRKSKSNFTKGMKVEVRSDEEGYVGSLYGAVILEQMEENRFLVEYETLKTDDETEFLKEVALDSCIRPQPPDVQRTHFSHRELIDAWYNEGWWIGRISQVHDGSKYTVYFPLTDENLEFKHSDLRVHQYLLDGKWRVG